MVVHDGARWFDPHQEMVDLRLGLGDTHSKEDWQP
jgi:lantibiotic modifying enzyme